MVKERQSLNENDDLWRALANNNTSTFYREEIKSIIAEVPGENDELDWWWILKLDTRKYLLLRGWCDYTGWDCRSGIDELGIFKSALLAAKAAPESGDYRNVRNTLIGQVKGTTPFATIIIENKVE